MGELWLNNSSNTASSHGIISEFIPSLSGPSLNAAQVSIYGRSGDHSVSRITASGVVRTYSLFLKYDVNHEPEKVMFSRIDSYGYVLNSNGSYKMFASNSPVRLIQDGSLGNGYLFAKIAKCTGKVFSPNVKIPGVNAYYMRVQDDGGEFVNNLVANANDARIVFQKFLGAPSGAKTLIFDGNIDEYTQDPEKQYPKYCYYLGGSTIEDVYGQGAKMSVKFQVNL